MGVDLRPTSDPGRGPIYHPLLTLDDGAQVTFVVDEFENDYGITPQYHPPPPVTAVTITDEQIRALRLAFAT